MKDQDILREQVKVAKALNPQWTYRAMAEVIGISTNAFYNWLSNAYDLGEKKESQLEGFINDLLA